MGRKNSTLADRASENLEDRIRKDAEYRQEERRIWLECVRDLPPHDRAEFYLQDKARSCERFDNLEALVYVNSRGRGCNEVIEKWACHGEMAAQDAVMGFHYSLRGQGRDELSTYDRAGEPVIGINNFWGFSAEEDAMMLRAAQTCELGFEGWLTRLVKNTRGCVLQDIQCDGKSAFAMCRSDQAIQRMPDTLRQCLDSMQHIREPVYQPWVFHCSEPPNGCPKAAVSVPNVAYILFVAKRLAQELPRAVEQSANRLLFETQLECGGWPSLSKVDKMPSILATAEVLHALALTRPAGWELLANRAVTWLWSVQDGAGFWWERVDHWDRRWPVYATVLVLDAIDLALGRTRVTFSMSKDDRERQLKAPLLGEEQKDPTTGSEPDVVIPASGYATDDPAKTGDHRSSQSQSVSEPRPNLESVEAGDTILKLEAETPEIDRDSGLWVRNKRAAELEGLQTETLKSYRSAGVRNGEMTLGHDRDGRVWRRTGTPNSHPWYLRSTLKSEQQNRG